MIRIVFRVALALAVFSTLGGCVARTYWTGYRPLPGKPADAPIQVFYPGDVLPKAYVPVGAMRVDGYYFTGSDILLQGAKAQARKRGGDAIVVAGFGSAGASTTAYMGGRPAEVGAVAVTDGQVAAAAVVYRAPTPPTAVPINVAWPILSALVIKWVDQPEDNGQRVAVAGQGQASFPSLSGENWKFTSETDKERFYLDLSQAKRSEGHVWVWTKSVIDIPDGDSGRFLKGFLMGRFEIDCGEPRVKAIEAYQGLVSQAPSPYPINEKDWQIIKEKSFLLPIREMACQIVK